MKKVLITGANSYIGISFANWMQQYPGEMKIDELDMLDEKWSEKDFSPYDAIIHVAAIVHVKNQQEELYQKINCDLVKEVATKAKREGVKQFVFLSTMAVYDNRVENITEGAPLRPLTPYAVSKLNAENELNNLRDDKFKVAILRPPFVYGKGCKGNYVHLRKFALGMPFFAKYGNQRSMIYIDNLCEFLRVMILNAEDGLFHPQNKEYVCTYDLVNKIALYNNKKLHLTKMLNLPIKCCIKQRTINKVFGDWVYDKSLSQYKQNYQVVDFDQSVYKTEQNV